MFVNAKSVSHPSEDLLEKFAQQRCNEEELEVVETHILGCEICVTKLEEIEDFLNAFQPGYEEFRRSRSWPVKRSSFQWGIGIAAAAVLGVGLSFVPRLSNHGISSLPAVQVQLSAERGNEAVIAPASRSLHIRLTATDLPQGTLAVEAVNAFGNSVWKGATEVTHEEATVSLPPMAPGYYFLRLYAGTKDESDLLREFAFQIK